jgi:hypothetical protein
MFFDNTYKNWENTQRRVGHYDLFSQIAVLKNAMNKKNWIVSLLPLYVVCEKSVN